MGEGGNRGEEVRAGGREEAGAGGRRWERGKEVRAGGSRWEQVGEGPALGAQAGREEPAGEKEPAGAPGGPSQHGSGEGSAI